MNILKYPPSPPKKMVLVSSIVSLVLLLERLFVGWSSRSLVLLIVYLIVLGSIAFMMLVFLYCCVMSSVTRKFLSDLSVVSRTSSYVRGEGFKSVLNIHLDRRLGVRKLRKINDPFKKTLIIYQEFLIVLEQVKKGLVSGERIYDGVDRVCAMSMLITPSRMNGLGIQVRPVESKVDIAFLKVFLKLSRIKSPKKAKVYYFDLSVEEVLRINSELLSEKVSRLLQRA